MDAQGSGRVGDARRLQLDVLIVDNRKKSFVSGHQGCMRQALFLRALSSPSTPSLHMAKEYTRLVEIYFVAC